MKIPAHWQTHQAPGGTFEISLPPSWKASSQGDSLLITPGTGSGYLTILAKPLTPGEATQEIEEILSGLFPKRRDIGITPIPDGPFWIWGRNGEAVLRQPKGWWKRILSRPEWQRWVLWVAKSGESLILALYLPRNERDPEEESLVRLVLGTLKPTLPPLKTPREFLQRVLDFLKRHYPEQKVASGNQMTLLFGKAVINMEQAWKEYQQTPDKFEEIALARLRPTSTSLIRVPLPAELSWESNRARVMPMLLPEDEIALRQRDLVCNDWIAGLKIAYVLDEPEIYRYITLPLFARWGVSLEEIHSQALKNLEGYFQNRPMEIAASQKLDTTQVLLPVKADTYNTSRLLSESFQKVLREYLGREYAVGLPTRDLFVAMRIDRTQLVSDIRKKIMEDFSTREFPLSRRMLLISPDGVSELTDVDITED